MSFSVDDLVSSLSSSHIGQEARDLAALQMQLRQTIFPGPRGRTANPHATTPISRTPSSSMSRWPSTVPSRRGSSAVHPGTADIDEMDEDERMVEELLMPRSPNAQSIPGSSCQTPHFSSHFPHVMPSSPVSPSYSMNYTPMQQQQQPATSPVANPSMNPHAVDASSTFATSDPFYLASLQEANAQQPPSVFAQSACLSQNSPFAIPAMTQGQYHHHPTPHFYHQHYATAF